MSTLPYILIPEVTYSGNQLSQSQIENVDSIPFLQANVNSATSSNTASTIMKRDGVGSFSGNIATLNAVESIGNLLEIGSNSDTQSINVGCGAGVQNVNIGTTSGTTTINLGGVGDSVVVQGTLVTVNTTDLAVADKNIIMNTNGATASGFGAGISIWEGTNPAAGYIQVSSDRLGWDMKPPAGGILKMNQSTDTTANPTFLGTTVGLNYNLSGSGQVVFANWSTARKRMVIYERGTATNITDHQFDGIGKGPSELVYQVGTIGVDHVFYVATAATTSNELLRVKSTGGVKVTGSSPQIDVMATADNLETSVKFNSNLLGSAYWSMGHNSWSSGVGNFGIGHSSAGIALKIDSSKTVSLAGALSVAGIASHSKNISCGNQIANKILALYDIGVTTDQTAQDYFGLGINVATLRYQVKDTTSDHVFYASTSATASNELMRIKGNGTGVIMPSGATVQGALNVQYNATCGSLVLPAPGGTVTPLACFEEADYSTTFTLSPYSTVVAFKISKIGHTVTLSFLNGYSATGSSVNGAWTNSASTLIPTRFCPAGTFNFPMYVYNNSVQQIGLLTIFSAGNMIISAGAGANFIGTGGMQFREVAVSYAVP